MHYYQHHIGDFIKDTSYLTNEEIGIYMKLIWLYYDTEEPLHNNIKILLIKLSSRDKMDEVLNILHLFFVLDEAENVWRHTRCDREIADYQAFCAKQKANGLKGGRPKVTQQEPNDNPMGFQAKPKITLTTNHKPITSSGAITEKTKKRKTAMILNKDTMPENYEEFIKVERPDLDPLQTYYKFCDYWLGNGEVKADWLATWRNWVRNEKKQSKPKSDVSNFEEMMRSAK
jgi:uncharacterized protein YdaU (DUF1376 family)